MSQRSWLLGLVVAVLAAGLFLFWNPGADSSDGPGADLGGELVERGQRGDMTLDAGAVAAKQASEGRTAIGDPDPETWQLAGRVVVDGPWPSEEQLAVTADGLRTSVAADGRFTLEVPEGRDSLALELDGRFVYLDEPLRISRGSLVAGSRVELRAKLGAWLQVELVGTSDVTMEELEAAEVVAVVYRGEPAWKRALVGLGGGRFEARALPVEQLFSVSVSGDTIAGAGAVDLRAFAGEAVRERYEVRRGARVSGQVLGPDDEPLARARVSAARENPLPGSMVSYVDRTRIKTDEWGHFDFEGLEPGTWRLEASASGFLGVAEDVGELVDGDRRKGFLLRLGSGLSITGTVLFPSGEPAFSELSLSPVGDPSLTSYSVCTLADGSFHFDGLPPGLFVLGALAESEDGGIWRATTGRLALSPEGGDLAGINLVVGPGDRIAGSVHGDDGAPLERFNVRARPLGADLAVLSSGSVRERFSRAGGSFELVGLTEGTWDVTVEAKGFADAAPVRVRLPEGPSQLAFTLDRLATVSGVVRLPDGTPVEGADVVAVAPGSTAKDKTDDEGRFELDDVVPGAVAVSAGLDGMRDAGAISLELVPGEERAGVELTLRVGASISGRIDAGIEGFEARPILASPEDSFENFKALCDEQGRFHFEGLEPGTWSVMFDWMSGAGEDWTVGYAAREEVELELFEGQTTEVVLGAPLPGAVRVSGRVTDEGEAMATYLVYVYPEHNDTKKPAAMPITIGRTDADGRYDMVLPGAGTYHFSVGPDTRFQVRFLETVPAGSEATIDFELPGCVIAGRVELADGSPVPRHAVMLVRTGAPVASRTFGDLHNSGADADGNFRFEGIQPGRYDLRTGGWGLAAGGLGVRVLASIEVAEDQPLDDLVLVVDSEAVVGGEVLDSAGAPVAGAKLEVFDDEGSTLFIWREHLTDHAGAFRLVGISAGDVVLRATAPDSRTGELNLTLTPGEVRDVVVRLAE